MPTMTAREAAARMGVKVETLYAYVSRGLLERHRSNDGRTSVFDAAAVEALAVRGRPRQSSRSTSLNMLIETSLTELDSQGVRYRGLPSVELARTHTFEDVAELLWTGRIGHRQHGWVGEAVELPSGVGRDVDDVLRVAAMLAATRLDQRPLAGVDPFVDVAPVGRWLIASITDSLPVAGDGRAPRLTLPDGSEPLRSTIAGRLWTRLSPRRPAPGMLAALNAALVVMADHELAASTLGVRVAASARAEPAHAVVAGLGVLSGRLHGAASRLARGLLDAALADGPARALHAAEREGNRFPGFGHKVYPDTDPRAVALFDLLRAANPHHRVLAVADELADAVYVRVGRRPNVDFALAALTSVGQMPVDGGVAVMSIARIAGWLGHAAEEYREYPLRFRPRAAYVGDRPRPDVGAASGGDRDRRHRSGAGPRGGSGGRLSH